MKLPGKDFYERGSDEGNQNPSFHLIKDTEYNTNENRNNKKPVFFAHVENTKYL